MSASTTEIAALKTRMKATWMAGDFSQIARTYEPGAEEFVMRTNPAPGKHLLDVACGAGNLALPAARAGATVKAIDIAPNLLAQGRARARFEGVEIQFDEGDAEELPYADGSFDVVVSMFGSMFAPRPEKVAAELTRVCRSGGLIALANWRPSSFVAQLFKVTGSYVPPSPHVPSPLLWGDETVVRERLDDKIEDIRFSRRLISMKFPFSPSAVVEFGRVYYGPTNRAFEALSAEPQKQATLRADLEALWTAHNQANDGTTHVESEYLEVIATRA